VSVKRYVCFYDTFMEAESEEDENGEWVKYEDYAALQAEVSRLKMEESKLLTLCETYEGDLERLIKAGDELADKAKLAGCNECFGMFNALEDALDAWNAAKEGKGQP